MKITELVDVDVTIQRSKKDGAILVMIDTTFAEGDDKIRVELNDGVLFDGDPETTSSAASYLDDILGVLLETNDGQIYPTNAAGDAVLRRKVHGILREAGMRP